MRILHTMIRVGNLDASLAFYTEVLGMRLLRRNDFPEGKFTLAFVGYEDEADGAVLELTYNWGVDTYEIGGGMTYLAPRSSVRSSAVIKHSLVKFFGSMTAAFTLLKILNSSASRTS